MPAMQNIELTLRVDFQNILLAAGFEDEWEDYVEEAVVWICLCNENMAEIIHELESCLTDYAQVQEVLWAEKNFCELMQQGERDALPSWFLEMWAEREELKAEITEYMEEIRVFMDTVFPELPENETDKVDKF